MVVRFSEILNAVILFNIFIVCRILEHMCVQYLFELVEFLLQFIYLIYIVVYNVFCVRRVRLFSHRSIYISGNIFANRVGPLLSGHPGDFENWPLNRGSGR